MNKLNLTKLNEPWKWHIKLGLISCYTWLIPLLVFACNSFSTAFQLPILRITQDQLKSLPFTPTVHRVYLVFNGTSTLDIGQFVPTTGGWNRLRRLRMANETQCIILQSIICVHFRKFRKVSDGSNNLRTTEISLWEDRHQDFLSACSLRLPFPHSARLRWSPMFWSRPTLTIAAQLLHIQGTAHCLDNERRQPEEKD